MSRVRAGHSSRRFFGITVALVLIATLVACGGDGTSTESPGATESPGGGGTSGPSDRVLRVVAPTEPETFDVVEDPFGLGRIYRAIIEPLITQDPTTGALTGDGLITDWEQVSATEWNFTVREGVTFHNGQEFNADAVVHTVLAYRDHALGGNSLFAKITEATAINPTTVNVVTDVPGPEIPAVFSYAYAVPNEFDSQAGLGEWNAHPIGTGPFEFVERQRGVSITTAAYEDYWGGPPGVAGIEFVFGEEATVRGGMVESGDADLALDIPYNLLPQYEGNDDVEVLTGDASERFLVGFDASVPPFDDVDLRRAAQLAIDRQSLVDNLFGGSENAAVLDYVFAAEGYDPAPPPPDWVEYNPDEATTIIDSLGSTPEIKLTYVTGARPNDGELGEAVAGMLEQVGFVVEREPVTPAEFSDRRGPGAGMEMMIRYAQAPFSHPFVYISQYVTEGSSQHLCVYPEQDALHDEILDTVDPEERRQMYLELEELFTGENACMLPLVTYDLNYVHTPELEGVVIPYSGLPYYAPMTLG